MWSGAHVLDPVPSEYQENWVLSERFLFIFKNQVIVCRSICIDGRQGWGFDLRLSKNDKKNRGKNCQLIPLTLFMLYWKLWMNVSVQYETAAVATRQREWKKKNSDSKMEQENSSKILSTQCAWNNRQLNNHPGTKGVNYKEVDFHKVNFIYAFIYIVWFPVFFYSFFHSLSLLSFGVGVLRVRLNRT